MRAALTALLVAATSCVLLACSSPKPPPPALQNRCPPNRSDCQIEIALTDVGLGERVARLEGRLSAERASVRYLFTVAAGETLRMKLSGPAIHLFLTRPDGRVDGPGLPAEIVLSTKGKYALRVAANTTAGDGYGDYWLELRLSRPR